MEKTLGNRIAGWRKAKGMSQEDLAEEVGVSSQAVSKWENDVSCPDISLLPKLAQLLGVTVDELLTGRSDGVKYLPEDQRKPLEELTLRVRFNSEEGDKVRLNLPMPLVKLGLEVGIDIIPNQVEGMEAIRNIDLNKIIDLAEKGLIGKIVEFESAEGDTLEVVVE